MTQPYWQFASTGGGTEDGVSNPEIEHFEGDYNYFLAREILQNALDVRLDKNEPVKVVFTLELFSQQMFPEYNKFLDIWQRAQRFWPKEDLKCQEFLKSGIDCLMADQINVLKISDYNTQGLNGSDNEREKGWFGLVKSVGSSNKHEGEGGSFGIGKGAPFSASLLRTCFYSTVNDIGQNVFQGVSKIVSHDDSNGDVKRGYGSFGLPNQSSVRNREQIDGHMARKERGLDIFVMGYKVEENWQQKLVESVLRNFWPAIHKDELIVEVGNTIISQKNLENLLVRHFHDQLSKDQTKPVGNPLTYYEALTKGKPFNKKLSLLGDSKFYFYQTTDHLNHVAMIRKSHMVIYSKLFHHTDAFAGVFICEDDVGNNILRQLEPPPHDDWDSERDKVNGRKALKAIGEWIRGLLKELKEIQTSGVQDIPGLSKYLPFNDDTDNSELGNRETTETETEKETASLMQSSNVFESFPVITPYSVSILNSPDSGRGGSGTSIRSKKKISAKKKIGGGGKGNQPAIRHNPTTARSYLVERKDRILTYSIVLNPRENLKCSLKISAVGEEGEEKVFIRRAVEDNKNLRFSSNSISLLRLEKDQTKKIQVEIESPIKLALKIQVNDLQQ